MGIMEKRKNRNQSSNNTNRKSSNKSSDFTIIEYFLMNFLLSFAAKPLHIQHFRIELLLAFIFIILWRLQKEMYTLGYVGIGIIIVTCTLVVPKVTDYIFSFMKKVIQLFIIPIQKSIQIFGYPLKLLINYATGLNIIIHDHHEHNHSHLHHNEDEDIINVVSEDEIINPNNNTSSII